MYVDKKQNRLTIAVLCVLLVVLVLVLFNWTFKGATHHVDEQGAEALREAVQRSALQCYAVEGVYPPNLQYLEEHYGLQVNRTRFTIIYDAFASNLPPDIRVIPRS